MLVRVAGTEADRRLVREAGRYVAGTGGRLVVLSVTSSREFAERREARLGAGLPGYTLGEAEAGARRLARRVGREALAPLGIDYVAVGAVGREASRVLDAAREHDCGHLFLAEPERSGLRSLVAGSVVETIARGFDGLVTVLREDDRRGTGRATVG